MDDSLKNAVTYISDHLKDNPEADVSKIVNAACQKFDLNPMQAEFLVNKYLLNK